MTSVRGDRSRGPSTAVAPAASWPHGIWATAWRTVLRRVLRHVLTDRLMVQSAAVAFFALLSIAPVLVTAISVYGAVNTPEQALLQLSRAAGVLPADLNSVVAEQLRTITTASTQVLTWRGLAALAVALWTATTAMTYLIDGLTIAYHEAETRSFLRRSALSLLFVLGGAVLLGAVIVVASKSARWLAGAPAPVQVLEPVLGWAVLAALMAEVLAVLYRFGPARRAARWRWISGGSAIATLLWLATTIGLFAYVEGLGSYEATYGSLAGVAISMLWLWVTVCLVILGAVVNAETERETAWDSTIGPDLPLGRRGAVVADSTPPYPGD